MLPFVCTAVLQVTTAIPWLMEAAVVLATVTETLETVTPRLEVSGWQYSNILSGTAPSTPI